MSLEHVLLPLDQLHLQSIELAATTVTIGAASVQARAACPSCQGESGRVHSTYTRTVADLPWSTRRLLLHLEVRRWFCDWPHCSRRTFAERFGPVLLPYARRTTRLTDALSAIGFAAGSSGAARLAHLLAMPLSPRTALRIMHAPCLPAPPAPRVVGLDDWAWKKGRSYGSICVDLERHQPIDLLPDREPTTIAAWLQAHPTIEIVARDRGKEYVDGVQHGAPQAIQVADRWHLIKNLGDALEYLFHHHSHVLKQTCTELDAQADVSPAAQRPVPTLDGTTTAERVKVASQGWSAAALDRYHQVHALHQEGLDVATIARHLQISRPTVYRYLRMREPPQPASTHLRERHVIEPWKPYLIQRWNDGCRNALELWRELRDQQGYRHSPRTVARFLEVLRRDSGTYRSFRQVAPAPIYRDQTERHRPLTALQAKRLWLSDPATRTPWLEAYRLALCTREQTLADAYVLTQRFLSMARERAGDELDHWLCDAQRSGIPQLATFATGLQRDYAAVQAGLTLEWSNGQTEAQVQRLKLLKRQMYGQAGFPLLRKRVVHRAPVLPIQHKRHAATPAAA